MRQNKEDELTHIPQRSRYDSLQIPLVVFSKHRLLLWTISPSGNILHHGCFRFDGPLDSMW